MKFTKMHGIGNDYVYVNGFVEHVADPANVARKIADRHFGVGGDGLILIVPPDSKNADVRMRMFNADGSEAEMCGNGVRCVAKYAFEHGLSKRNPMKVETGRGVLSLSLATQNGHVSSITVNMGEPILEPAKIPVDLSKVSPGLHPREYDISFSGATDPDEEKPRLNETDEPPVTATFVSMGNPHAVTYVSDVDAVNLNFIGPLIEHHVAFPRRMNAHFVQIISPTEVKMRTWERGSGITLACGTGACAVCVAGVLTGKTQRNILAHLPGGDLELEWRESDNCVYMSGPATEVFSGEWNGDFLKST
jgi:diaminopimelate epimerase